MLVWIYSIHIVGAVITIADVFLSSLSSHCSLSPSPSSSWMSPVRLFSVLQFLFEYAIRKYRNGFEAKVLVYISHKKPFQIKHTIWVIEQQSNSTIAAAAAAATVSMRRLSFENIEQNTSARKHFSFSQRHSVYILINKWV